MTEAEWLAFMYPEKVRAALVQLGSERKLRLFVAACLRECSQVKAKQTGREVAALNEDWADDPFHEAGWVAARQAIPRASSIEKTPIERVLYSGVNSDSGWAATGVSWGAAVLVADAATPPFGTPGRSERWDESRAQVLKQHYRLLRDIFGNHLCAVAIAPAWRTDTVVLLARQMYESRNFSTMPILADALQDAGCDDEDVLNHCRQLGEHVRGCWVADLLLGRE